MEARLRGVLNITCDCVSILYAGIRIIIIYYTRVVNDAIIIKVSNFEKRYGYNFVFNNCYRFVASSYNVESVILHNNIIVLLTICGIAMGVKKKKIS